MFGWCQENENAKYFFAFHWLNGLDFDLGGTKHHKDKCPLWIHGPLGTGTQIPFLSFSFVQQPSVVLLHPEPFIVPLDDEKATSR